MVSLMSINFAKCNEKLHYSIGRLAKIYIKNKCKKDDFVLKYIQLQIEMCIGHTTSVVYFFMMALA